MKKKEIWFLTVIAAIAAIIIVGMKIVKRTNENKVNENKGSGYVVDVYHRDLVVQEFDPYVDATYTIQGDYGTLEVEVKDHKWRVTNEECPNHICAQMGWVGVDDWMPITCIPNNVIVVQKGAD